MGRILVLSRNLQHRTEVRATLEGMGHEVAEAENGDDGLNSHHWNKGDVVVIDLAAPDREGVQTALMLRLMKDPPEVIVLCGQAGFHSETFLHTASKSGGITILRKPYDNALFASAVTEALLKRKFHL